MTKRRRRIFLCGFCLLILGLIWSRIVIWPPKDPVSPENFAKIHVGMTFDEIKALLGKPTRGWTTGPLFREDTRFEWASEDERGYDINVTFTRDEGDGLIVDRAYEATFFFSKGMEFPQYSAWERIRRFVGL